MQSIELSIKGISPLMLSAEAPYEDTGGSTGPKKRQEKPSDQARSHLHLVKMNGRGELAVLPAINLQKSIQAAHSFMPARKKGWKKFINGCLVLSPTHLVLEPQVWTVDARRTSGANGRGGPINYRPRFDAWAVNATLSFDERFLSEEEARAFVDLAGQYVGVGSWRVGVGGPFGKYIVTGWNVTA
jgi:hypothetical protein